MIETCRSDGDAFQEERRSFQKKKHEGGLFTDDHSERMHMPQISRKTAVNDDILAELYNRYKLLLDELDSYK
jgi:hypothetical protein